MLLLIQTERSLLKSLKSSSLFYHKHMQRKEKSIVHVVMLCTDNYLILYARIYYRAFIFLSGTHLGNYIRK